MPNGPIYPRSRTRTKNIVNQLRERDTRSKCRVRFQFSQGRSSQQLFF